jgi:hypothetical protein
VHTFKIELEFTIAHCAHTDKGMKLCEERIRDAMLKAAADVTNPHRSDPGAVDFYHLAYRTK